MKLIINKKTDPHFNLALEEYLLTQTDLDVIMLWRNERSVIIGCNQNAVEELDVDFVRDNGITVVRRQSGGGAVFHDLGNINFTVIHALGDDDFSNYTKFTAPICDFLHTLGIGAELQGRNDLTIDGLKFSGNAQAVKKGRIMHHGTILYNADFGELGRALKPREAKIASKGVKSVRARVTNVALHLENPMPAENFFEKLADYFLKSVDGIEPYELAEADITETEKLAREKYSRWDWSFGKSPAYTFENSARFPFGLVDLRLVVEQGTIKEAYIFGDFFGKLDISGLTSLLVGLRHDRAEVEQAMREVSLGEYISGMSLKDFIGMF